MSRPRFADGSGGGSNKLKMEAAFVRTIDALLDIKRRADRVSKALDESPATAGPAIPQEIPPEDSLVIAVQDIRPARNPSEIQASADDTGKKP